MELHVFAAVLFSAFFQAGWNFLTKKSSADKIALLAVGWFAFGVALLPFALYETPFNTIPAEAFWYMAGSGFIHGFYVCLLGWAYTVGEISVVYPVARGLGIVGTTIASLLLGLHGISIPGIAGILAVVFGTFLIGLKEMPEAARRHAFFVAVLVAIAVSSYSVVDSLGAKKVPMTLYLASMNVMAPIFASPFLLTRMRAEICTVIRSHKLEAMLVTLAGSFAYAIILWAFQRSPTAYVATLREFSVVIASLLGVLVLKERLYKRKAVGIGLILLGVICLKVA